ncbi:phosphoribosylanthranilate isomerase [Aquimarina addita]|uniref:N-(5'-phosphoribosyl)anthranilate isomerase n=1 Tax=Aquimarina addita TaxID=870485 RepID=A0ABP6UQ14_9FLAO
MKLKVCGMKYEENIEAVAALRPDYLGFIFYKKSPRHFEHTIPQLPESIKKTGVFVDASIDFILEKVAMYGFRAVQLHGNETAAYCMELKTRLQTMHTTASSNKIELFKVFSIKDQFDFNILKPYEGIVDYFLFDTKGKEKGGNGYVFDWSVLKEYHSTTPFILSGGIGPDEMNAVLSFKNSPASRYLYAIDVNSKFEIEPGLKNVDQLKTYIAKLKNNSN